ncbi:MAG: hypothetical protein ABL901_15915 [Hyphomicrobiaceae bacterium]|nr:hypothetical protein [Hyphomicrobiaceae bacterium]
MTGLNYGEVLSGYQNVANTWHLPALRGCRLDVKPITLTSSRDVAQCIRQESNNGAQGWVLFQSTGVRAFGFAGLELEPDCAEPVLAAELLCAGGAASLSLRHTHGNTWKGAKLSEVHGNTTHLAQAVSFLTDRSVLVRSVAAQGLPSGEAENITLDYVRYWSRPDDDGPMRPVAARFFGFGCLAQDKARYVS